MSKDMSNLASKFSRAKKLTASSPSALRAPHLPMSCLARDQDTPEGLTKGSLTTDPKEIDQILVRTWAQIFRGNGDDIDNIAYEFMKNMIHTLSTLSRNGK